MSDLLVILGGLALIGLPPTVIGIAYSRSMLSLKRMLILESIVMEFIVVALAAALMRTPPGVISWSTFAMVAVGCALSLAFVSMRLYPALKERERLREAGQAPQDQQVTWRHIVMAVVVLAGLTGLIVLRSRG